MAYVEVKAKTVEMAIEAAMRELGVTDRQRLDIEVMQEPERGFLGFGGQDAIVKVRERSGGDRGRSRKARQARSSSGESRSRSGAARGDERGRGQSPQTSGTRPKQESRNKGQKRVKKDDDRDDLTSAAQAELVEGFLTGLVDAFGLEGGVETRVEDEVIVADITGEQTEALVGQRGTVMEALHELSKTVLQRSARESARLRLDVAGYAERRRQALTIYAGDLIDQVLEDGGELMLEPMSAADRKVIHDAVAAREGVRSYSEGEAPGRYVVIAASNNDAAGSGQAGSEEE